MSSSTVTIYALYDTRDEHQTARYVGQTTDSPRKRKAGHRYMAKHRRPSPFFTWILSLETDQLGFRELETCEYADRFKREAHWIAELNDGNLFNELDGSRLSVRMRDEISARQRGTTRTEETRARISATLDGRPLTTAGKQARAEYVKTAEWQERSAAQAKLGNHKRWHVSKNKINPDCEHCR